MISLLKLETGPFISIRCALIVIALDSMLCSVLLLSEIQIPLLELKLDCAFSSNNSSSSDFVFVFIHIFLVVKMSILILNFLVSSLYFRGVEYWKS